MINRGACRLCAILIGALLIGPGLAIFWNRTPPFENVHTFNRPDTAKPGDAVATVFTISNVRRECQGEFDRLLVDSAGRLFYMGTFPTIYHYGQEPTRTFDKVWKVPRGETAEDDPRPGKAVYRTVPRFWCNQMQKLHPIAAQPVNVPIVILPRS